MLWYLQIPEHLLYSPERRNYMIQDRREYMKAYYQAHREQHKAYMKAYYEAHKDEHKAYMKAYHQANREKCLAKKKSDLNSLGQTKHSIRMKSQRYLKKYGKKIEGYQIHHCFTYDDPYKFIYCSKEMHRLIHAYLRQHNIDADSNHYEYIAHLLDDTVVLYGL